MTKTELKPYIQVWAAKYGVQPSLVYGVIMSESGGDPLAARFENNYRWLYQPSSVKPLVCSLQTEQFLQKTSIGLMQVMGAVYRECGYRGWLTALFSDVGRQVQYGTKHLAKMIKRYGELPGISAYNAGRPVNSNATYVERVLAHSREYD